MNTYCDFNLLMYVGRFDCPIREVDEWIEEMELLSESYEHM